VARLIVTNRSIYEYWGLLLSSNQPSCLHIQRNQRVRPGHNHRVLQSLFADSADRLVRDVNGNPLVGTNYLAQLYLGATPETLMAHTAAPARFRAAQTSMPGTWVSGNRSLAAPGPGPIVLEVRVWDSAAGATYEQASQNTTGLQYGKSGTFNYDPCGTPIPMPNCELMLGFLGFTLRTNAIPPRPNVDDPRKRSLGGRALSGDPHHPGRAVDSGSVDNRLFIHGAVYRSGFRDKQRTVYRMMDEPGPLYSLNAVGYYRLELCAGLSLVANQFHHVGAIRWTISLARLRRVRAFTSSAPISECTR
jgi:hypothetical protein